MPDRGVASAAVVAVLDPRRDVADRAGPGGPDATVLELCFQGREEALGHGRIGFSIRIVVLANGQSQANARMRDELGSLCRLKVVRATEEEAHRALDEQSEAIRHGGVGPTLTSYSTIAEAASVFLDDKRRSETLEVSTIGTY